MTRLTVTDLDQATRKRLEAKGVDLGRPARDRTHRKELPADGATVLRCCACGQEFTAYPPAEKHVLGEHRGGAIGNVLPFDRSRAAHPSNGRRP